MHNPWNSGGQHKNTCDVERCQNVSSLWNIIQYKPSIIENNKPLLECTDIGW